MPFSILVKFRYVAETDDAGLSLIFFNFWFVFTVLWYFFAWNWFVSDMSFTNSTCLCEIPFIHNSLQTYGTYFWYVNTFLIPSHCKLQIQTFSSKSLPFFHAWSNGNLHVYKISASDVGQQPTLLLLKMNTLWTLFTVSFSEST